MFDRRDKARVFGTPLGVDFATALTQGLVARMADQPPEALARVEIFANSRRMQRRIKSAFEAGKARLLPRIRLVSDLAHDTRFVDLPPLASPLRRRLELTQLVQKLLDQQPDLAPRSALFDLSDSLARLMDEMQGEGVSPGTLRAIDVTDVSHHWQRSLQFISLVDDYFRDDLATSHDAEARQRLVVDRFEAHWRVTPPDHPVIVAGSTGSRGATAKFMRAVAGLPQGAIVVPGFDFDLPDTVWAMLDNAMSAEDHPQYRFAKLIQDLDISPSDVAHWVASENSAIQSRNRLISLALRPAPVTDQWMIEGGRLADLDSATKNITLVEAPSLRTEASAIALVLRQALEQGKTAALISPDRMLTRQVTAALGRWGITPDDSAGRPLPLSAPGRFLRHVSSLFGQKCTSVMLLALLKHPLCNTGGASRGAHLLHTRELELWLRRYGPPFPTARDLTFWAAKGDEDRQSWAAWLGERVEDLEFIQNRSLSAHLEHHIALSQSLCAGPGQEGSGQLWLEAAGQEAAKWVNALQHEAEFGGVMSASDYTAMFQSVLQRGEVRESVLPHPDITILGTQEARVQGADLVVLAGLNEGVWPGQPDPDPWLNRAMRYRAGLRLPERQIGLAAHDFQQAVAADEVVLSRAIRDAEAQTVPSRWLNRLTNLLGGISSKSVSNLAQMRERGAVWVDLADRLDLPNAPVPPAIRPSPQPPIADRPNEISITEVQTLIRDPYAVYARRILGLNPLDPLLQQPDPPLRGIIVHKILERFIGDGPIGRAEDAKAKLLAIAKEVLTAEAAWPAARRLWLAGIMQSADWLIAGEIQRQSNATPLALESQARHHFAKLDVTLVGKIDRIDRSNAGQVSIFDYKTGTPPSKDQQEHFDKQLVLSALLAELGAIKNHTAMSVEKAAYIGVGTNPKFVPNPVNSDDLDTVSADFHRLILSYQDPQSGYTSRRAVASQSLSGRYDHLARFGEWDQSSDPTRESVG